MTRREIANLCCRVLAVYTLIQGISMAPSALGAIGMYADGMPSSMWFWYVAVVVLHPVMYIALGVLLWRKSGIVAAWMIGHDLQDEQNEPEVDRRRPTAREMHAIAFSTMGLWLLVTSVPTLISAGMSLVAYSQTQPLPEHYARAWGIDSLGDVAKAVIGAYLLFGASGLVKLLRGTKNFGLLENETPEFTRTADSATQASHADARSGDRA